MTHDDLGGEWLDIYDDNLCWIGRKERESVHRDGDWHRTFHCWMIRRSPRPAVLFQQRSLAKLDNPGLWDTSVAGHVLAGETSAEAAREIPEEVGIPLDRLSLTPAGLRVKPSRTSDRVDREFQSVFLTEVDWGLEAFHLQPDEVTGLAWLNLQDGWELFQGRQARVMVEALDSHGNFGWLSLTMQSFVPCADGYYQRVLINAERYLAGLTDLAV